MNNRNFEVYIVTLIIAIFLIFEVGKIFNLSEFERLGSIYKFANLVDIVLPLFLVLYSINLIRTINRNPKSFSIALLGFPNTGKTVYLTVLFDLLQRKKTRSLIFSPYGAETIEQVAKDYNTLVSNNWLPRTSVNKVFFYRAYATLKRSPSFLLSKRFKIEVGDFAGEKFDELNPTSSSWLHRSEYFDYVITSDAIFLTLDVMYILDEKEEKILEYQNSFIVALNIYAEKKGLFENKKIDIPVSILFLKSDILSLRDVKEVAIIDKVSRLLEVCRIKCQYFDYFFVSSIGHTQYNKDQFVHLPPTQIEPDNVIEPLYWTLRHSPLPAII
ncbi:hypothetical protein [Spirosoma foliorum]|uniref:Uncharacterized protein n=1 Tax=Spirosoma foliorum TaxID=2710596 RepID=A0A7G5H5G7_9BACT|nr:hypothetical protein [Spirosoma foliorum]QMW06359.1 hypothetical protein H3H32_16445 [Spirosoma foliorum]